MWGQYCELNQSETRVYHYTSTPPQYSLLRNRNIVEYSVNAQHRQIILLCETKTKSAAKSARNTHNARTNLWIAFPRWRYLMTNKLKKGIHFWADNAIISIRNCSAAINYSVCPYFIRVIPEQLKWDNDQANVTWINSDYTDGQGVIPLLHSKYVLKNAWRNKNAWSLYFA